MRLAVHATALAEIFGGNCDSLTVNAVLSARIAVTAQVLGQYQATLSGNQMFLAWFTSTSSAGRLSLHMPQLAPQQVRAADTTCDGYATPAYFAGGTLAAEPQHLPQNSIPTLVSIGVELLSVRSRVQGRLHGDNPFFTITTRAGGNLGPEALDRFVLPEERIVVYDKYINASSMELLQHIATVLKPGSTMEIFHAGRVGAHLLDTHAILGGVQGANANINVSCKTASSGFLSLAHDRYIFLGNRMQVVFSAGLDSFGTVNPATGRRSNRQSAIVFYDVCGGEPLAIEASDGSISRVNHIADLA